MTKADITGKVAMETGLPESTVKVVLEKCFKQIRKEMIDGNNVYIRGFGSFILKKRKQKTARNINKGTSIIVPAHNIPFFKPNKDFKNKVK